MADGLVLVTDGLTLDLRPTSEVGHGLVVGRPVHTCLPGDPESIDDCVLCEIEDDDRYRRRLDR